MNVKGKFFGRVFLFLFFSTMVPFGVFAISCWDIITEDTNLTEDLLNCRYYGLEIGAGNITLDCQGHTISGSFDNAGIIVPNHEFDGVKIRNCVLQNFKYGMTFSGNFGEISNNIFQNNRYNGLNYFGNDSVISGNIFRNHPVNNGIGGFGLKLGPPIIGKIRRNVISGNIMENNYHGVSLEDDVLDNRFMDNVVANNSISGFRIQRQVINNIFSGNVVKNNRIGFNFLGDKINGNQFFSNYITGNRTAGIQVDSGSDVSNMIYNNYFHNPVNVIDPYAANVWNIEKTEGTNIIGGPYTAGNYWSDYNGLDLDGDGIGDTDTPHDSNGNIRTGGDYLPLVFHMGVPQLATPRRWP